MKYKGQLIIGGKSISEVMMKATHPSQVARRLTVDVKRRYPNLEIFGIAVKNEIGEHWSYSINRVNGVYQIKVN